MAAIFIPVALCLFLGPGIGQLYNKDYKKGVILILASLALLVIAAVWYLNALKPYLPTDLAQSDPQALQQLVANANTQLSAEKGTLLSVFQALMMVLWIYGIIDAYRVADRKREKNTEGKES